MDEAARAVDVAFRAMSRAKVDRTGPAPAAVAWRAAAQAFSSALTRAYPALFWESVEALKAGDRVGLDEVIAFLEADPWFFRSGYAKELAATLVKRFDLSEKQAARLRGVVLAKVDGRSGREFRRYGGLARRIDSPELRQALHGRLDAHDHDIRRRAGWILEALGERTTR